MKLKTIAEIQDAVLADKLNPTQVFVAMCDVIGASAKKAACASKLKTSEDQARVEQLEMALESARLCITQGDSYRAKKAIDSALNAAMNKERGK